MTDYEWMNVDLRAVQIEAELLALQEHLQLIEDEIKRLHERELATAIQESQRLKPTDSEEKQWLIEYHRYRAEVRIPRLFRGPFLVALWSVYESSVIEIAHTIQNKLHAKICINDVTGQFLDRAKKYFESVLEFDLCPNDSHWCSIKELYTLRNAFAHSSGRMDHVKQNVRKRITRLAQGNRGIRIDNYGIISCDGQFVERSFRLVQTSLVDLVARYKDWDDGRHPRP